MKPSIWIISLLLLAVAGCAPKAGLRFTYVEIEGYPLELQEKIRTGEAAIGMTPVQVRYALGAPDNARTFSPEDGRIAEEWSYASGMGLSKKLIVFENGTVVKIETEKRRLPNIRVEKVDKEK